jgi:hypothetical protein
MRCDMLDVGTLTSLSRAMAFGSWELDGWELAGQNVTRPCTCSHRGVFHCCVTTLKFELVGDVFG